MTNKTNLFLPQPAKKEIGLDSEKLDGIKKPTIGSKPALAKRPVTLKVQISVLLSICLAFKLISVLLVLIPS